MIPASLLVVTDRHGSTRPLAETVQAALAGGARWIWFRDKDLARDARHALALDLLAVVREAGGALTIGGDVELAREIGAGGVHLGTESLIDESYVPGHHPIIASEAKQSREAASSTTMAGLLRFARNDGDGRHQEADVSCALPLVGISAHGFNDVRQAAAWGAHYATFSPIFPTASKPGYGPALGLDGLRAATASSLPVIALGGVSHNNARACLDAGAAGVAVMGAIMSANDPAAETRRLIAALGSAT